jgi:hypothetical protein
MQTTMSLIHAAVQRLGRWPIAGAAVVLALLLLPGLGGPGLLDPWEMDRAAVARWMAGSPRVVIAEAPGGPLGKVVEAAGQFAVVYPANPGASAQQALQAAHQRLQRQAAHALVIDLDALAGEDPAAGPRREHLDAAIDVLTRIESANRGLVVIGVSEAKDPALLRLQTGAARVRALHKTNGGFVAAFWNAKDLDLALAKPLGRGETVVPRAQLAAAVRDLAARPMRTPVFKKDGQSQSVPWLEAVLPAASLRVFGTSEWAVRLPGALIALLAGLVVVWGAARLAGNAAAWLALCVYATLPLTVGLGRTLSFEATAPLGHALFGVGMLTAFTGARAMWLPLALAGLFVLGAGDGLGGLAAAAGGALAAALATATRKRAVWATAALAGVGLAFAAWLVLSHPESALLRGLRFTQWPFSAGPDPTRREFAWLVGQVGFGLYPWGALSAVALGALIGLPGAGDDLPSDTRRTRIALAVLALSPIVAAAAFVRPFQHFVAPVGPLAALATAWLLRDGLDGRLQGRVLAAFVLLGTLLLHREIGKGPEAVTRFFAFDPPFSTTGDPAWPQELMLPRGLRAVALLAVVAFCLGIAEPVRTMRSVLEKLRHPRAAAWALGGIGIVYGLDVLVSVATKLDVLLKTATATSGYAYDRLWVTIQATRPELVAGAVTTVALIVVAAGVTLQERARAEERWWLRLPIQVGSLLQWRVVALSAIAVAAVAVLLSGLAVLVRVQELGWGAALARGMQSAAFVVPAVTLVLAAVLRWLIPPRDQQKDHWLDPMREDSLLSPLLNGLWLETPLVLGALLLAALAGIGIGASQAAGTWSYAYLGATWGLFLALALVIAGVAQYRPAGYGLPIAVLGLWVVATLLQPLSARYLGEVTDGTGPRYLRHVLLTAPDTGGLLVLCAAVVVNRMALRRALLSRAVEFAVGLVARTERPKVAAGLLALAGVAFTTGYAWTLLPGLSVHYSQKHLLQKIAEAGGTRKDPSGTPRTFSHGSSRAGSDNNFYLQSMPSLDERNAVVALLAGKGTRARITEQGENGGTRTVDLQGWVKQEGEAPALPLLDKPLQRFVVVPRDAFSELNHAFRRAESGRHIPVVDAVSSRLVLCANLLQPRQLDQNWVKQAIIGLGDFAKLPGIKRIRANFDDSIELIGYKLADESVARAQKYKMTLYWHVKKPTVTSWKLFMHPHPLHLDRWPLTQPDPSEDDNKPCVGCFQTNHWLAGDVIVDSFEQEVPLGTNAGPNEIILGWYNPAGDNRMPVLSASGQGVFKHADNRVTIGHLQVR